MKKCCICAKEIISSEPSLLSFRKDGSSMEVCEECDKWLAVLENESKTPERKRAIGHFYSMIDDIEDAETYNCLCNLLEPESSVNLQQDTGTVSVKSKDTADNIWIRLVRIYCWVIYAAIIITGIAFGSLTGGGSGFLIFLLSVVIAFISVAGMMIYLDMVSDISEIKKLLAEKKDNSVKKGHKNERRN